MSLIARTINRLYDAVCDTKLGIQSSGVYASDAESKYNDNVECNPTSHRILNKVFKKLAISAADNEVFVDFGCGKGRAVCVAAQYPFKTVIGIEISPKWSAEAERNIHSLKTKKTDDIKIVTGNALEFDCKEGSLYYFYNPFGKQTFSEVIDNIHQSLEANPRTMRIVYYNTLCKDILDNASWLQQRTVLHYDSSRNPEVLLYDNAD